MKATIDSKLDAKGENIIEKLGAIVDANMMTLKRKLEIRIDDNTRKLFLSVDKSNNKIPSGVKRFGR